MRIQHVVLTGGSCAGKSTMGPELVKRLTTPTRTVFFVPELATLAWQSGVNPSHMGPLGRRALVRGMMALEDTWTEFARTTSQTNTLIIHDRGVLDDLPYVKSYTEYVESLAALGLDIEKAYARYDMVIQLESLAWTATYDQSSNPHRYSSKEAARQDDVILRLAYMDHPSYHYVPTRQGSTLLSFEERTHRTAKIIQSVFE